MQPLLNHGLRTPKRRYPNPEFLFSPRHPEDPSIEVVAVRRSKRAHWLDSLQKREAIQDVADSIIEAPNSQSSLRALRELHRSATWFDPYLRCLLPSVPAEYSVAVFED